MQITCPACAATYEVPSTALKPGQLVRCARCAGEWAPLSATPDANTAAQAAREPPSSPPAGPATDDATAENALTSTPGRAAPRAPKSGQAAPRRGVALSLAWAASVIAMLLLGWAGYAERSAIMQLWPPSVRLYAALGLAAGH
jgi:predicted Zn finger-like uncharacterized protein